jgi:hypothetical protein
MNPDYEAMQKVVLENEAALKAADLERVMATFAPDPTFDVYPFGLHIAGDEAAREMFAGMLASGMASFDSRQIGLWVNDEGVIRELVAVLQGLDEFFGFEIPEGATAEMHTMSSSSRGARSRRNERILTARNCWNSSDIRRRSSCAGRNSLKAE